MSTPFLGEIRLMSFLFAPRGWAQCSGQLLQINQNQALFALLGTSYGGNGQTNFALPDLRGRIPIQVGNGYVQGERGGEEAHTLTTTELPTHVHDLRFSNQSATSADPTGNLPAKTVTPAYGPAQSLVAMNAQALTNSGGSQPHLNMPPVLVLNFCIALQGIFPSQN